MMRILDLALKDIRQVLRDRRSLIFLIIMPIVFTLFMGFAYKGTGNGDNRISMGWINLDDKGILSARLYQAYSDSQSIRVVTLSAEDIDPSLQKVARGSLAGLIVVPQDFSKDAFNGKPVQVTLYTDPASNTGQSLFQTARSPLTRLLGSVEIANQTANMLEKDSANTTSGEARNDLLQSTFQIASDSWDKLSSEGPQIKLEKSIVQSKDQPFGGNPYNQSSPGILTQFAIFGLVSSSGILVQERKTRTLQRMMTTSMHSGEIIAGHMLANFLLCFSQTALLVVFGQLVLKVDYAREPAAVLFISLALSLWISALGLFIGVFAKSDQQVTLFAMITMFVFSALGGTWFPLETSGKAFAAIGQFTPAAWAMQGYQNILIRGLGLTSSLLPACILLSFTAGFFGLAVWRFAKQGIR
jgi:ABC-2 type transport system permease protein